MGCRGFWLILALREDFKLDKNGSEQAIGGGASSRTFAGDPQGADENEFLRTGKKRLAGENARAATTDEVKVLSREARDLKEVVAEQALDLRLLKKEHDRG